MYAVCTRGGSSIRAAALVCTVFLSAMVKFFNFGKEGEKANAPITLVEAEIENNLLSVHAHLHAKMTIPQQPS